MMAIIIIIIRKHSLPGALTKDKMMNNNDKTNLNTTNPPYNDTQNNDKFCYNENLNVTNLRSRGDS